MSTQSTKTARRPAKASRRTVKKSAKSARASTKKLASKSARRTAVTMTRTRPVALESRGTTTKSALAVKSAAKTAVKAVAKPVIKPVEQPAAKAVTKASAKSVSKTVSKIAAGIAAKISSAAKVAAKEAAPKIIRTYSPPVQPAAPELPIVRHKYQVGETVYFTSPNFGRTAASGTYTVIKQLPSESDDYQYRIKSSGEAFERVAKESQLDRV